MNAGKRFFLLLTLLLTLALLVACGGGDETSEEMSTEAAPAPTQEVVVPTTAPEAEATLPPFSHQALLRADSPHDQAALDFLRQALATAQPLAPPSIELWGPAPAQMERRAGRVRAQLLLQAPNRGLLQTLLGRLLPRLRALPAPRHLRWSIDVDPQDSF